LLFSIGCNKNFTGNAALDTREKIKHWLGELCAEVAERLENDRETVRCNLNVALSFYLLDNFFFQTE
jgi:DNA polymerase eta